MVHRLRLRKSKCYVLLVSRPILPSVHWIDWLAVVRETLSLDLCERLVTDILETVESLMGM